MPKSDTATRQIAGAACIGLFMGVFNAQAVWAAPDSTQLYSVQDVYDCVTLNLPQGGFSHDANIEVRNNRGQHRRLQARVTGEHSARQLLLNIRLLAPGNVAGTTVLLREQAAGPDDIRLYLPALKRTRYISDALSSTRLFDTDFSYADFKQLYGQFSDSPSEYLGIDKWQGRQVHMLRVLPAAEAHLPYASLITRIDTATCVIVGMDFLDADDQPQRRMRADPDSIHAVDVYHLPGRVTMTDLRHGSRTILKLSNIRVEQKLPAFRFEPDAFYLEKPEPEEEPPLVLPEEAGEVPATDI